jgi:hypothetical protein
MDDVRLGREVSCSAKETNQMTIQSKLAPFIAAGMLLSSVAAHSQTATDPDPDVAPSTADEEAQLPAAPADKPELATDPDPDLAPSTAPQSKTGK